MAYHLSATKLQHYQRCPQSYYFRYEYGLRDVAAFGSATLGSALHQALADLYNHWHYQEPIPPLSWLQTCWQTQIPRLNETQVQEGWRILETYYTHYIQAPGVLRRPIAVEGRIQGELRTDNIEFILSGRYDRLDALEDGLELIDYKSNKAPILPDPHTLDLQIGLYYLALEQHYHQALRRLSLIYLRTGEKVSLEVSPSHKHQVEAIISKLALQLREEQDWPPSPGQQCDRCAYARYCTAVKSCPDPLPARAIAPRELQLCLGI